MARPAVLLLGPLPPPVMGPTLATAILLESKLCDDFTIIHLDTSDHRGLESLGAVDARNVLLGLRHLGALAAAVVRRRPALVYVPISQTTPGFLRDSLFILAARLLGRPVACHLRGGDFRNWVEGSSFPNRLFVRFVLRQVQAVIVLGEKLRPLFAGYVDDDRIFVVPNGADYDLPPPQRRQGRGATLLYLGSLKEAKGIGDVVEALAVLAGDGDHGISLDAAGTWREEKIRKRCIELCAARGLAATFHAPASGREKAKLYGGADIFVFTPRGPEGHPWVIVEAMAAGLPVITTDRGAIAEAVVDGENGFIVAAGRPDEIAAKVRLLAGDPELRRKMGRHSRERYEKLFTERKMVEAMAVAFRAAMGGRR